MRSDQRSDEPTLRLPSAPPARRPSSAAPSAAASSPSDHVAPPARRPSSAAPSAAASSPSDHVTPPARRPSVFACVAVAVFAVALAGCGRAPTPLNPAYAGSIGTPNRGVLTASEELPRSGPGFKWLRGDDHHHGVPRFVAAIERAAAKVARERPGAMLSVGDISARGGGRLMPHLSHRSGRDADLLLYWTTLDGVPVETTDWHHVQADGLAWDEKGKRFLRFDVEREWLLVKTLVEDPDARVQWVFANHKVEALLIEWARARGEPSETIVHAMDVMLEPHPGGAHDDHVHVRTQCTAEEMASGCELTGPPREWLVKLDRIVEPTSDFELALALFHPFAKP